MKLTIERAALLKALGHVQSVVERRNTIPILSNVLLRGADGKLALSATDMDIEMISSVPAQGVKTGGTTVPAHTLYDITRKLPEGAQVALEIGADKGQMTLRSGRSTFTLACLPAEDYPVMSGSDLAHNFTISAADLKRLIDRTRFAISTEETRYYLNGIYLHIAGSAKDATLRAVAT
ncbi:MAG: DNA polymerase III subunit beta, partial [Stellaceae bacterium]